MSMSRASLQSIEDGCHAKVKFALVEPQDLVGARTRSWVLSWELARGVAEVCDPMQGRKSSPAARGGRTVRAGRREGVRLAFRVGRVR
jgi:hypothetical protein